MQFIVFSLYYFLNSKLLLICFLQFFFIKRYNNFFTFKITNSTCPWHSVFNLFNYKNFFRPIWNTAYCKNVFIFWYFNNITNFKLRIFIINFFTTVNICVWFYINKLYFYCAMICIASNLSIYTFFWHWSHIIINFVL